MRIRTFLLAAAFVAASAAPDVAQMSAANAAWPKGPEQFIMSNEEKAAWAKVSSDDAAAAFIKDFWARRDPAFRQEFESKVKYADEHFKSSRQRGATTDRGKILILFGTPTRVTKEGGSQRQGGFDDTTTSGGGTGFHENETARQTWIYEGDASQKVFGIPRTEITFTDQFGNGDFRVSNSRVDVNAMQQKVIDASLAHAPAAAQQPPAAVPQPAAAPAPALPADALKTQALRDAIAAPKAGTSTPEKGGLVYAEFVAPSSD